MPVRAKLRRVVWLPKRHHLRIESAGSGKIVRALLGLCITRSGALHANYSFAMCSMPSVSAFVGLAFGSIRHELMF